MKTADLTDAQPHYTLYRFPSLGGSPKGFRFMITAWLYAVFCCGGCVCELKDNRTGKYSAYWA